MYTDNPHKKSKKESIALILLGAPDRDKDSKEMNMDAEDYAMSVADDDQKQELMDMDMKDSKDLPVDEIMETLEKFDLPPELSDKIEKHLRGEEC